MSLGKTRRLAKGVLNPRKVLLDLWRRSRIGSFELRLACDAVTRPYYSYCMFEAAKLTSRLGFSRLSVVEFGVAGGNGLIEMEKIAAEIEKQLDIQFEIFGFDLGSGLPQPIDYRDLPYEFREGQYLMDEVKLRNRLNRAQLVLGDVKDSVPTFVEKYAPAPVGFVALDLDFYSSTVDAIKLLEVNHEHLLPRIFCYLDDVVGPGWLLNNDWVGELLAIKEFNEKHERRKIAPIYGLRHKRIVEAAWNDKVFAFHDFDHPLYNTYMGPPSRRQRQLPIK